MLGFVCRLNCTLAILFTMTEGYEASNEVIGCTKITRFPTIRKEYHNSSFERHNFDSASGSDQAPTTVVGYRMEVHKHSIFTRWFRKSKYYETPVLVEEATPFPLERQTTPSSSYSSLKPRTLKRIFHRKRGPKAPVKGSLLAKTDITSNSNSALSLAYSNSKDDQTLTQRLLGNYDEIDRELNSIPFNLSPSKSEDCTRPSTLRSVMQKMKQYSPKRSSTADLHSLATDDNHEEEEMEEEFNPYEIAKKRKKEDALSITSSEIALTLKYNVRLNCTQEKVNKISSIRDSIIKTFSVRRKNKKDDSKTPLLSLQDLNNSSVSELDSEETMMEYLINGKHKLEQLDQSEMTGTTKVSDKSQTTNFTAVSNLDQLYDWNTNASESEYKQLFNSPRRISTTNNLFNYNINKEFNTNEFN